MGLWKNITAPFLAIWERIKETFSGIFGGGSALGEGVNKTSVLKKVAEGAGKVFEFIGDVLGVIGKILGFIIKVALIPTRIIIESILFVFKAIASVIKFVGKIILKFLMVPFNAVKGAI